MPMLHCAGCAASSTCPPTGGEPRAHSASNLGHLLLHHTRRIDCLLAAGRRYTSLTVRSEADTQRPSQPCQNSYRRRGSSGDRQLTATHRTPIADIRAKIGKFLTVPHEAVQELPGCPSHPLQQVQCPRIGDVLLSPHANVGVTKVLEDAERPLGLLGDALRAERVEREGEVVV